MSILSMLASTSQEPRDNARSLCLSIVLVGFLVGCGGEPPLPSASGTVTYEGKPVEGATVTFSNESAAVVATGKTDADGKFTLHTYLKGPGAMPGSYQVTVRKTNHDEAALRTTNAPAPAEPQGGDIGEMMAAAMESPVEPPEATRELLPEKYKEFKYSGLTFEVTEDGPNEFQIDL